MTVTYDVTDDTGKLRLAISDIDTTTTTGLRSTWTILFTDEELAVFLTQSSSNIWLAASYALSSMAASRAMLAKVRKLGDFSEDLTKLADALRAQAKEYKALATEAPAAGWAEMALTNFSVRDIINNKYLRNG